MTTRPPTLLEWKYSTFKSDGRAHAMRPYEFPDFAAAIEQCSHQFQYRSTKVHTEMWQGVKIGDKPEMRMHELTHVCFAVDLHTENTESYRQSIQPNLPWADKHFEERVCGLPLNPGTEWANWPYGKSAERFLEDGKFNHNYMERYWPKLAGLPKEPTFDWGDYNKKFYDEQHANPDMIMPRHQGIKYSYGDLGDVVNLLAKDPLTRQAYLPVWFPEDTGGGHKRAPCTIGYHFMMRDGKLDVTYHIRSCDFVRHFRDDLYLTVRLLLWVLQECRKIEFDGDHTKDGGWHSVQPGKLIIQIGSFHIFANDYHMLFGASK